MELIFQSFFGYCFTKYAGYRKELYSGNAYVIINLKSRCNGTIKYIFRKEKLLYYAQELKKKKFKPGFDGMSAQSALLWLEINGETLIWQLLRGSYDPMPAVGFCTAKQNGGYRQLAKLSALDMVIQNTLISEVAPTCKSQFSDYTYAYRPNCGVYLGRDDKRFFCALFMKNWTALLR